METPEVLTDSKNTFEYDEEQYHEISEYINRNFELLLLILLIEAFENGKNSITLRELLKDDYWKIDYIREEVIDSHDWPDIYSMVLGTLVFIIEDLRLGKIIEVALTDYGEAKDIIPMNAVMSLKDKNPEEVRYDDAENTGMHYRALVDELIKLSPIYEERLSRLREKWQNEKDSDGSWTRFKEDSERLPFSKDEYKRHLDVLALEVPELVEIVFLLNEEKIKELKEKIAEFLTEFSDDKHLGNVPDYQDARLYFAKQLENFATYINKLPLVRNTANVPFEILFEKGFEAVKVIRFLELKNRLTITWSDNDHWHIEFANVPISPASLLGLEIESPHEKVAHVEELKFDLSFSPKSGMLEFNEEKKFKVQGQVQKELLRVLFENTKNLGEIWNIWDISDRLGPADVNEKSIINAAYQLNNRISLRFPAIQNFLIRDKNTVQLNPKYTSKLK